MLAKPDPLPLSDICPYKIVSFESILSAYKS